MTMDTQPLSLVLPTYDAEYYEGRYAELHALKFEVPRDLEPLGYLGINDKFGELDALMTRANVLVIEAERAYGQARTFHDAAKAAYKAKYAAILSSKKPDEFQSIKAVEAAVEHELREDVQTMTRAKLTMGLFQAYLNSAKSAYATLENSKRTLKAQNENYMRLHPPPPNSMPHGYR